MENPNLRSKGQSSIDKTKLFEQNMFYKYNPIKKFKQNSNKKVSNENPFKILKNLNLG